MWVSGASSQRALHEGSTAHHPALCRGVRANKAPWHPKQIAGELPPRQCDTYLSFALADWPGYLLG
jgi:hypothetical protein